MLGTDQAEENCHQAPMIMVLNFVSDGSHT